jgi:hypothetical protein
MTTTQPGRLATRPCRAVNAIHEHLIEALSHLNETTNYNRLIEYLDNTYPGLTMFLTPNTINHIATKYQLGELRTTPRGTTFWHPDRRPNNGPNTSRHLTVQNAIHTVLTQTTQPLTARQISRRHSSRLNIHANERDRILNQLVENGTITKTTTKDPRNRPQHHYHITQPPTPTPNQPTNHVPW